VQKPLVYVRTFDHKIVALDRVVAVKLIENGTLIAMRTRDKSVFYVRSAVIDELQNVLDRLRSRV
jgi:hypothetical protein